MDSDHAGNPNHSFFPFDRLPDEIQSRIFSLLPITTLVLCKAVSPSWRSIIRSPAFTASYRPSRDPIFLLYRYYLGPTKAACAYLPSTDSWIDFHFPQPLSILPTTGTSLLLSEFDRDHRYIVNPFSPPRPINFLPPVLHPHRWYKQLALIEHSPSDYMIVIVSPFDGGHTETYDSRSGCWEERDHLPIGWGFINLSNAVYLDGLLFCLSRQPNHLLTFDPVRGQWSIMFDLDLPIPSFTYYLLVFGGELYLTALLWEDMNTRIGIWELEWSTMAWKEFDFMPDKYLAEFSDRGLSCLIMTACMGMICFSTLDTKEIVMCDLAVRRWWCPQPCNIPGERGLTFGSAIEPHINLLK